MDFSGRGEDRGASSERSGSRRSGRKDGDGEFTGGGVRKGGEGVQGQAGGVQNASTFSFFLSFPSRKITKNHVLKIARVNKCSY